MPIRLRKYFRGWLAKRIPQAKQVTLNHRNLFILPSKAGVAYLVLLVVLWLVATNYENNLIFAITFLLTALFVTGIHHTHAGLSGITLSAGKSSPAFCGEPCGFDIVLRHNGKQRRDGIQLFFRQGETAHVSLPEGELQRIVGVRLKSRHRGWFDPGRLTIESVYPLGLFRVWSHIKLDTQALVYPRPMEGEAISRTGPSTGNGRLNAMTGSEDFIGLDRYRSGQSLRHVAWKHYAREQGFLTKYYADFQDQNLWLDWDSLPGRDREARLSMLCGQLLALAEQQFSYGLRLPGIVIQPGQGDAHRDKLLKALALFEGAFVAGQGSNAA